VAALRTEVGLARLGFGVIGLHVVDDNFLQPEPGMSAKEMGKGIERVKKKRRKSSPTQNGKEKKKKCKKNSKKN